MTQLTDKTYYFIAGLPRSGSTVLSAILNQNPRFYSGPSSPISGLMVQVEQILMNDQLFLAYPNQNRGKEIVSNMIHNFYYDIKTPVIFDKNRSWTDRPEYIEGYFNTIPKIICPVRNIDEILTSFISMHKRNPIEVNGRLNFIDEMLVKMNILLNDENRCKFISSAEGILGQSYNSIKKCLMDGKEKYLHFVEYDDLISSPEKTMNQIYEFLDEEYYDHDFNSLNSVDRENDAMVYGIADMHEIRNKLGKTSLSPKKVLPESILSGCKDLEFWRNI
jgi:sulfotransferase